MPYFRNAEELAHADWTQLTERELPAYKSGEFFALLAELDVTLDQFRRMPVYEYAVDVGLIQNDEWTSIEIKIPAALGEYLWKLVQKLVGRTPSTATGERFRIVSVDPGREDHAITIELESPHLRYAITRTEMEWAVELWLGGGAITPKNLRDSGGPQRNAPYVAVIFDEVAAHLWSFGVTLEEFRQLPVYAILNSHNMLGDVGDPARPSKRESPRPR